MKRRVKFKPWLYQYYALDDKAHYTRLPQPWFKPFTKLRLRRKRGNIAELKRLWYEEGYSKGNEDKLK